MSNIVENSWTKERVLAIQKKLEKACHQPTIKSGVDLAFTPLMTRILTDYFHQVILVHETLVHHIEIDSMIEEDFKKFSISLDMDPNIKVMSEMGSRLIKQSSCNEQVGDTLFKLFQQMYGDE